MRVRLKVLLNRLLISGALDAVLQLNQLVVCSKGFDPVLREFPQPPCGHRSDTATRFGSHSCFSAPALRLRTDLASPAASRHQVGPRSSTSAPAEEDPAILPDRCHFSDHASSRLYDVTSFEFQADKNVEAPLQQQMLDPCFGFTPIPWDLSRRPSLLFEVPNPLGLIVGGFNATHASKSWEPVDTQIVGNDELKAGICNEPRYTARQLHCCSTCEA